MNDWLFNFWWQQKVISMWLLLPVILFGIIMLIKIVCKKEK